MEKPCAHHNNPIVAVCLYKSCNKTLLCLKCLRDHDEDHDSLTHNVYDLVKSQDWVEPYEKQRDEIVTKEKDIFARKSQIVSSSQDILKGMLDSIAKIAEDQKGRLLEELNEMVDDDKNETVKELFTKLGNDTESLQKINFREGTDLERINQVKEFNETMTPNAEDISKQVQDTLQSWALDENKIKMYKEELVHLLQSIHLKDLLSSTPFKSMKETDTFFALKATNEWLEQELKNKMELLENQTQQGDKEKGKSDSGNSEDELTKVLSEKESLTNENSQLKEKIKVLETNIGSFTKYQEELKNRNSILDREVSQLTNELANLRRRNSLPHQIMDRKTQSYSGNGLFG